MPDRYLLEINEKQLYIARDALEFYNRFMSGQLDALPNELKFKVNRAGKAEELRDSLNVLKRILFPELAPNEDIGVGSDRNDPARLRQISYEMYRQIYVYDTRKRKESGQNVSMDVYSSETLNYSGEPLIKVIELEEEKKS